jgi:hypothetical protein
VISETLAHRDSFWASVRGTELAARRELSVSGFARSNLLPAVVTVIARASVRGRSIADTPLSAFHDED